MHSIITSYLLQTNKCALPHLGFFTTKYTPATYDTVNNEIVPPGEEIIFKEESIPVSPGLISYIAVQKRISEEEAGDLLDSFCKKWKEKIDGGESLCFDSFGCLQKNDPDSIYFTKEDPSTIYHQAVKATKVFHESIRPLSSQDDKEISPLAINEPYRAAPVVEKRRWKVPAFVLAIIAIAAIIYGMCNHKLAGSVTGNRNHFIIKEPEKTYSNGPG